MEKEVKAEKRPENRVLEVNKLEKKAEAPQPELIKEEDTFIGWTLPYIKHASRLIILILIVALFVTILYKLYILFAVDLFSGMFQEVINDLLLLLILIELFTILYSYLHKHYIKVERVVELGMISIIREMLFKVNEMEAAKIYAISVLLVSFGVIFFIEKYYSKTRNQ